MNRKIKESDYVIIAAMRNSGAKWGAIAPIFGVKPQTLRKLKSTIMKYATEGETLNAVDFAKARTLYEMMDNDDRDRSLRASKMVLDSDTSTPAGGSETRDDSVITLEIKRELSAS